MIALATPPGAVYRCVHGSPAANHGYGHRACLGAGARSPGCIRGMRRAVVWPINRRWGIDARPLHAARRFAWGGGGGGVGGGKGGGGNFFSCPVLVHEGAD